MKKSYCRLSLRKITRIMITSTVFVILVLAQVADAADQGNDTVKPMVTDQEKIYIIADKLIANGDSNSFEFIGNVKATQGDSVIKADRLKVFYKKSTDKNSGMLHGEQSIQKIIATGHVNITFDDRVAMTEKAVYTAETKILVLSGPDSKITRGSDTISGETITFYRADEQIKVESGKEKRVEAVFHTGDQGIN